MTAAASRIERRFAALKAEGRAGLVTFVTCGDPDYDVSLEIFKGLPASPTASNASWPTPRRPASTG